MMKPAILIAAATLLAAAALAQTTSSGGGRSTSAAVDVPAKDRAQAAATNKAALKSKRPNTLKRSDLVGATNDVGGRSSGAKQGKSSETPQPH